MQQIRLKTRNEECYAESAAALLLLETQPRSMSRLRMRVAMLQAIPSNIRKQQIAEWLLPDTQTNPERYSKIWFQKLLPPS